MAVKGLTMLRSFSSRVDAPTKTVDPLLPDDPPYLSFHLWLLVAAASVFAFFIAVTSGGMAFVVENDLTYISDAVMLFFIATTTYCGSRAWRLSRELIAVQQLAHDPNAATEIADSWVARFFAQSRKTSDPQMRNKLVDVLTEKLRGSHEIGWFITETMTKLGLLGTVIGFLIMLTALVGSSQLELSAMQSILRDMAAGMGIKIIATVVGLLCNIILALQWLLLDRCAEKVLAGAVYLGCVDTASAGVIGASANAIGTSASTALIPGQPA